MTVEYVQFQKFSHMTINENCEYEMVSCRYRALLNSSGISKVSMENTNEEFNL
jgi:hypothetical protein